MFNKKIIFILTIILVSLFAVSAVSAADNATSDVVGVEETDVTNEEIVDEFKLENDDLNDVLSANPKTFSALNTTINGNDDGDIYLEENYTFESGTSENDIVGDSSALDYYVDRSASTNGDGSSGLPFNNLKSAISKASAGDNIYIASGTYTGADNIGLTISKSLNLVKNGNGEVIFDAQNNGRIFTINVNSIRIDGLTFTRASDSAIVFTNGLDNGVIVADFNNNRNANGNGAAIYAMGNISNSLFIGDFNSNSAKNGAAIYADEIVSSTFNGDFTGNVAGEEGGAIHANIISSTFNGDLTDNGACDGGAIYGNIDDSIFNGNFTGNYAYDGNNVMSASMHNERLDFAPTFGGGVVCGNVGGTTFNTNFIANTAIIGAIIKGNVETSVFTGKFSGNSAEYGIIVSGNTIKSTFSGAFEDVPEHGANLFGGWLDSFIKDSFLDKDDKNREELENLSKEMEIEIESDLEIYVDSTSTLELNEAYVKYRINLLNLILVKTFKYTVPQLKDAANPFEGPLGDIVGELIDDLIGDLHDEFLERINGNSSTAYLTMEIRTLNNLEDATMIANTFGSLYGKKYITVGSNKQLTLNDMSVKMAPGVYKGDKNKGLEIFANTDLSLVKDGEGDVIIDAENNGTILTVISPEINITGLTFMHASNSSIIFKNGLSNSYINANFIDNVNKFYGGAIYCQGDIINSVFKGTFSDNSVGSTRDSAMYYGYGGAIYANNIESSTFESDFINNSASTKSRIHGNACYGGAIYANNISKSEFNGKFANNFAGFMGGAIFVRNNIVHSLFNSDFMNNEGCGGAIKANNIKNSTFNGSYMNNSAFSTSSYGAGVIYVNYDIEQSTFSGDFANNDGACYGGVLQCSNLKNSIFSGNFINNIAEWKGGALYVTEKMVDCEFTGNFINNRVTVYEEETSYGGAIYAYDIKYCDFYGKYIDNSAYHGGVIFVRDIDYSNFYGEYSGNSAEEGNVIWTFRFYNDPANGNPRYNTANIPENDVFDYYYRYNHYEELNLGNVLSCRDFDNFLIASSDGIYVDGSASFNGDGNLSTPFNNLNSAIEVANSGDTIYIAPGIYAGDENINLAITKRLNLVKNGNGEVIFDAQNNGGIFTIVPNSFNITGLTFMHASTSALVFLNGLKDSRIDAVFNDNKNNGGDGAAVYVRGYLSDTVFSGTYMNNAANANGGAIYAESFISCVFNADFKNNTAKANGGAIAGGVISCIFNGDFTNNNAAKGGAIYGNVSTSRFSGAFTNNKATHGGVIYGGVSSSNFTGDFTSNVASKKGGVINGRVSNSNFICNFKSNTAKNAAIVYSNGDFSKSVFKGNFIDNNISGNYGKLIYVTGSISYSNFVGSVFVSHQADMDSIIYSQRGIVVRCSFEDIAIETRIISQDTDVPYKEDCEFVATLTNADTGKTISGANVIVAIDGVNYALKTNSKGQVKVSTSDLALGSHIASVTYKGNSKYKPFNATFNVIVSKVDTCISAVYDKEAGELVATLTNAFTGKCLVSANVVVNLDGVDHALKTNSKGQVMLSTADLALGTYTATVSYKGNAKYNPAEAVVAVNTKYDTSISAVHDRQAGELVVTLTNATNGKALNSANVLVSINGAEYTLKTNSKGQARLSTSDLAPARYIASVSYKGNSKYNPSNATAVVNTRYDTSISAVYDADANQLIAALTNIEGKALNSANVVITLEGVDYALKTNSKGQVMVSTEDLDPGTYVAYVSYKGNSKYNPSNDSLKFIVKADTRISASKVSVNYNDGGELVATLINKFTGNAIVGAKIVIVLNDVEHSLKTDANGQVSVSTDGLAPGNYTASVSYAGNFKYNPSTKNVKVVVNKGFVNLSAQNISVSYNDGSNFVVTFSNAATGRTIQGAVVVINVGGVKYSLKTDSDGQVSISTDALIPGSYVADISYAGNSKYNPSNTTAKVMVKADTCISAPDITVDYNSGGEFVATLINNFTGNAIGGANIVINLNDVKYALKTNSKGQVKISTDGLTPGTYVADISYAGNSKYNPSSAAAKVIVKADTRISASKISVIYNDGSEFVATLINKFTGNAIVGAKVVIVLNDVEYSLKTDANGQVSVSTDGLIPGNYTASVSYAGNFKYNPSSKNVKVVVEKADVVISVDDINVLYPVDSVDLVATLTSAVTGKPLNGANVVVNFDGVDYALKTNSKGQVVLSTGDLSIKVHTATISYAGNSKFNPATATAKIIVSANTVIAASDVNVVYRDESCELIATLSNAVTGNGVGGVTLIINVDGVEYSAKTDSNGQIKFSTSVLAPGTHSASISFGGTTRYKPSSTSVKIVVAKADVALSADDISVAYNGGDELVIGLTNAYGQALSGANLVVSIDGDSFTVKTNASGQAAVSCDGLAPGSHAASISYAGNSKYNSASATANIAVSKAPTAIIALSSDGVILASLTNGVSGKTISGAKVIVEINGVKYSESTNSNGQVGFSIGGLAPGKYAATVYYNGNAKYDPSSTTVNMVIK